MVLPFKSCFSQQPSVNGLAEVDIGKYQVSSFLTIGKWFCFSEVVMQFVIGKWRGSSCIISSRCKFLRFFGIQSLFTQEVWQPLLSSIRVPSWLNRGSCSTSNLHLSLYISFQVRSLHNIIHCIAFALSSVASRASQSEIRSNWSGDQSTNQARVFLKEKKP